MIDDKIGVDIFHIKTRSNAKASGEQVGEVHGANKPLDPSYKPEHQSKSKLPSVIGKQSPVKTLRKSILRTPLKQTLKMLTTPKSVTIQSTPISEMEVPTPETRLQNTPVSTHRGARPKTHKVDGTPLLPPPVLPPLSQQQPIIPRRILSSTPSGKNGENMDKNSKIIKDVEERIHIIEKKRQELEKKNRKIFHPPPMEGMDVGVTEGLETLDPEIRIPNDEDFVLPPALESLLDKAKTAYKFLPKQGDIDRLIAKINKKVLRDTNLCERSKSSIFDKPTF